MDPKTRKRALRMLSNGVYIVTSRDGDRYGAATITWVTQASFRPPLLMAAIRRESNVYKCMVESRVAAIHILDVAQLDVARRFFAPTRLDGGVINGEPFDAGTTSAPVLQRMAAYVECHIRQIVENDGDHGIVIMEVVEAGCRRPVRPLTIAESPWEYGG